jgi:hypothetical protein
MPLRRFYPEWNGVPPLFSNASASQRRLFSFAHSIIKNRQTKAPKISITMQMASAMYNESKHRVLSFKQRLTGKIDATTNVDSNSDLRAAFPRFALESQHASGRSASPDCTTEEGHACSDRARLAAG